MANEFDATLDWFLLDAGRALFKAMSTRDDVLEWCIHAVVEISSARYDTLKRRYKNERAYDVVSVDGRFYVVGSRAGAEEGDVQARQTLAKFDPDYMRPIVVSMLLRLYEGEIPAVLNAMIGHAPKDFNHVSQVCRSVLGAYRYEYPQGKGAFRVAYAMPCDEIVGAAMNVSLNPNGIPYDKKTSDILNGTNLVFDLGGETLDLIYTKGGVPQYEKVFSESVGGNRHLASFCDLVAKDHKALVARTNDGRFPRDVAHKVLLSDKYTFEHLGDVYDLSPQFIEAYTPLLRAVETHVYDFTNGFIGVNNVLAAGGVTDTLYGRLIASPDKKGVSGVLYPFTTQGGKKKERLYRVDVRGEMFAGVVRGFRRLALAQILAMKGASKRGR